VGAYGISKRSRSISATRFISSSDSFPSRVGGFHFIKKREALAGDMVANRDIIGVGLKAQDLKKQLAPLEMRPSARGSMHGTKRSKRVCWGLLPRDGARKSAGSDLP
jgi:hypothetical protein